MVLHGRGHMSGRGIADILSFVKKAIDVGVPLAQAVRPLLGQGRRRRRRRVLGSGIRLAGQGMVGGRRRRRRMRLF